MTGSSACKRGASFGRVLRENGIHALIKRSWQAHCRFDTRQPFCETSIQP